MHYQLIKGGGGEVVAGDAGWDVMRKVMTLDIGAIIWPSSILLEICSDIQRVIIEKGLTQLVNAYSL